MNLIERGELSWRFNLDAIANNICTLRGFPEQEASCFDGPSIFIGGEHSNYITYVHLDPF